MGSLVSLISEHSVQLVSGLFSSETFAIFCDSLQEKAFPEHIRLLVKAGLTLAELLQLFEQTIIFNIGFVAVGAAPARWDRLVVMSLQY